MFSEAITAYFFDFIYSIFTGIVAGLVASGIFIHYTKRKIPNIKISQEIIIDSDPDTKERTLTFKFVNLSRRPIVHLSVYLYGNIYHNSDRSMNTYCLLGEKSVPYVPKFDKKDDKFGYAIQASMLKSESSDKILSDTKSYDTLSVKITGQDAIYGTFVTITKHYDLSDIKKDYIFELGVNTNARKVG